MRAVNEEWQQGWQDQEWEGAQETVWEEDGWHEQEEDHGAGGNADMPVEAYGHQETAEEEEAEDIWMY